MKKILTETFYPLYLHNSTKNVEKTKQEGKDSKNIKEKRVCKGKQAAITEVKLTGSNSHLSLCPLWTVSLHDQYWINRRSLIE